MAELIVEMVTNGPFMENCYVAADAETRRGILIDPGDEERRLIEVIKELDVEITEIVATHGHIDHAGAVAPLKRVLGVPFAIHSSERPWLERLPHQAAMFGLDDKETPEIDRELKHNDIVKVGGLEARVLHTPGHSAGGICLLLAPQKTVFVGDTLFAGGCGRLFEGTAEQMYHSLEKLRALPDETLLYCAHEYTQASLRFARVAEPDNSDIKARVSEVAARRQQHLPTVPATMGVEKATNPFLRSHLPHLAAAAAQFVGQPLNSPAEVLGAVRRWKDHLD